MQLGRNLWYAIAAIAILASIPSLAGMIFPPEGGSWTGILSRNTADVNGYLSMIEEVRQGHFRMRNLLTAERHEPFQIRPLWAVLGMMGRLFPGISNVCLMDGARVVTSTSLLILIAILVSRLFSATRDRFIAFLILTLGSGLGWLHLVPDPPDLRIVETSTFLTLVSPPLYSLSLSLVLASLLLVDRICSASARDVRPTQLSFIAAFFCVLWLGLDRPFSLAPLGVSVCGLILAEMIRDRRVHLRTWIRLLPPAAGAAMAVLYQMHAIRNVEVYAQWNRQHVLPTPSWPAVLSSLGLLIPLAFVGVRSFAKQNAAMAGLFAFYIAGSLVFSRLPFGFQERFLEGLPVATALFAAFGAVSIVKTIASKTAQTAFAAILIAVLSLSHYFPVRSDLVAIAKQAPPQYMPDKVLEAMRTLSVLAAQDEAVLSTEASGNFIIAYSGRPVVIGQKIQTAHYFEKASLVARYFATPAHHPQSEALFRRTGAVWLFWGPEESWRSAGVFNPSRAPYLEEVTHSNSFVRLFKLKY